MFQWCGSLRWVDFSSKSGVENAQYLDFLIITRSPVPFDQWARIFFTLLLLLYLRKPFLFFLTSLTNFSLTFLIPSLHSWAVSVLGSLFPLSPFVCFLSTSAEVPCSFMLAFSIPCSNSWILEWTTPGFKEVLWKKKRLQEGRGKSTF